MQHIYKCLYGDDILQHSLSLSHTNKTFSKKLRAELKSMENDKDEILRKKFMKEFPYESLASQKQLMVDLMLMLENSIGSQLLPCNLPVDVRNFTYSQSGSSDSNEASLRLRSGNISSPIKFMLGSWIHIKKQKAGEYINLTTISAYLKSSTKAPHFVFKLIQYSQTLLILILDLPHRKDLVLNPDYLKTFYKDTHLDSHRKSLLEFPEIKPFMFSALLSLRSALSPAAVMLEIKAENEEKMDEILRVHVDRLAKEFLSVWLERCAILEEDERVTNEEEIMELEKRDKVFRNISINSELMMFGKEVRSRVLDAIKEAVGDV